MTITLYAWGTPNGRKISVALEEMALTYTVVPIDIRKGDQFRPDFLRISPNNKIPAIFDPEGPGGAPVSVFESGAILIYLAEKTGKLLASEPRQRIETLAWLMFQMGGVGPMFGQVGFFHKFAGKDYEDKRPRDRYVAESKRLLGVLDQRLADRVWIMGDQYTIADMATFPWVRNLVGFYEAAHLVAIEAFPNVTRALGAFLERPAVARGIEIPRRVAAAA